MNFCFDTQFVEVDSVTVKIQEKSISHMRICLYVVKYKCWRVCALLSLVCAPKGVMSHQILLLATIFHLCYKFHCRCYKFAFVIAFFAVVIWVANAVDLTWPNEIGDDTLEWPLLSIADELIIKFSVETNSCLHIY